MKEFKPPKYTKRVEYLTPQEVKDRYWSIFTNSEKKIIQEMIDKKKWWYRLWNKLKML